MTEQTRKDILEVMLLYLHSNDALQECLKRLQARGLGEQQMNDTFCTLCEMIEGRI